MLFKLISLFIQEFAEKFDDIPDDIGFKIGDQVVSKAALKEALESQHTIEQREAELKPYYENIRVRAEMIQDALDMGKTETERMYEHFKSIAENPNTMASERGNAFSKMKDLERKYATLEAKQEEIKQERTKAEVERVSLQINAIEKSFPSQLEGWKPGESLQEVLDFAQSQGVSKSQLGNAFSPGLIKLLWIAKKAEDHKASSRQKLTEIVKAPRSVSSTASKREQAVDPKKSELLRKIDKHAITRKDVDTMFNMLED